MVQSECTQLHAFPQYLPKCNSFHKSLSQEVAKPFLRCVACRLKEAAADYLHALPREADILEKTLFSYSSNGVPDQFVQLYTQEQVAQYCLTRTMVFSVSLIFAIYTGHCAPVFAAPLQFYSY